MVTLEKLHAAFLNSAGACTDTRQLVPGGIFFALKGPNFDANAFAAKALEAGCAFAVVDDPSVVSGDRFLLVPDVLRSLQELGRYHRRGFVLPIIAITGTNGKTTTKELVHAVLGADRPTLATTGNLNNHIGVPLTLLRLTREHRIAIVEMGANHVGDIAELADIAEPTHGLITNIGRAHLEGFGGYDGVVRAKTELYDFIRAHSGTLFVHGDDPLLMEKSAGVARITYGTGANSDTEGAPVEAQDPFLHMSFRSADKGTRQKVATRLIGAYNAPNVVCAICIGHHFGVPDGTIARAVGGYTPTNNRSQFVDTGRNQVIMDAYNANPSSMAAALENFASLRGEREKLAILGGMKELGAASNDEHAALISLVRKLGIEALFVGPEFMEHQVKGIRTFADAQEALEFLGADPVSGKLILVKGSRGTQLEVLAPAL